MTSKRRAGVDSIRHNLLAQTTVGQPRMFNSAFAQSEFNAGLARHQAGDLDGAERYYASVLRIAPNHADAIHLSGVIAAQRGSYEAALPKMQAAIAIKPTESVYHANLAGALNALERFEEAAASARAAVRLDPRSAGAHTVLGNALRCLGRPQDARDHLLKAIEIDSRSSVAHTNLAISHYQDGELERALVHYRQSAELDPTTDARNSAGAMLLKLRRPEEAAMEYRRAIVEQPSKAAGFIELAAVLQQLDDLAGCLAAARQALVLEPVSPYAWQAMAAALQINGEREEALEAIDRFAALRSDTVEAAFQHGALLAGLRRYEDALTVLDRAIQLRPNYGPAHRARAHVLLALGDFAGGWRAHDWARDMSSPARRQHGAFAQPEWQGEAAEGKILLISQDHGLGDALCFSRFAPEAAARGLKVMLQTWSPLVRLFARSMPEVDVFSVDEPLPSFDMHIPEYSLPLALGTVPNAVPGAAGYLQADPDEVKAYGDKLDQIDGGRKFRIGVCWRGAPRPHDREQAEADALRSIPPELLLPLLSIDASIVSLQFGTTPSGDLDFVNLMDGVQDFADTAAIMQNLDVVLTVDSSPFHLAGALGIPTILLVRAAGSPYWAEGTSTPYYASVQVIHQEQSNNWRPAIERATAELAARAAKGRRPNPVRKPIRSTTMSEKFEVPEISDMPTLVCHNRLIGDHEALSKVWERTGYWYFRDVLDKTAVARLRQAFVDELNALGVVDDHGVTEGSVQWNGNPYTANRLNLPVDGKNAPWRIVADAPATKELMSSIFGAPLRWTNGVDYKSIGPKNMDCDRLPYCHQDAIYMSKPVKIVWIPLVSTDDQVGGLAIAEGLTAKINRHPAQALNGRRGIDPTTIPTHSWRRAECRAGDVILVNPWSPHAGISNISSDRFRLSMDVRLEW